LTLATGLISSLAHPGGNIMRGPRELANRSTPLQLAIKRIVIESL